jgi:hypothetical protein
MTANTTKANMHKLGLVVANDIYQQQSQRKTSPEETQKQKDEVDRLMDSYLDEIFFKAKLGKRLKDEPRGFAVKESKYACQVCGLPTDEDNSWFDKNGLKCLTCQKAIKDKIIPPSVSRNRSLWFSELEMKQHFQLNDKTLNKLLKSGKIHCRNIMTLSGKTIWFRVFVERENQEFIYRWFIGLLDGAPKTKQNEKCHSV